MALSFPLNITPPIKWRAGSMSIDRVMVSPRTRGGLVQVVERARPLWIARYETEQLSAADFHRVQAIIDSLRSGANTFYLSDPFRRRPLAYRGMGWAGFTRHGAGAFDGTATVTSASAYSVTIGSLPTSYVATPGDMISWPWRSTRTLHRVVQGGTAVNGVLTVQVEPDVPLGGTYPQTIKLEAADAVFRLAEAPEMKRELSYGLPISIQAVQAIY